MVAFYSAPTAQDKLQSRPSVWRWLEGVLVAMGQEEQSTVSDPRVTGFLRVASAVGIGLCLAITTRIGGILTEVRDNQIRYEARFAAIESASKIQGLTHEQLTKETFNLKVALKVLETEFKEYKRQHP